MTIGVDEVGRGCLAGPVCVAAVVLDGAIEGLRDSKLLTRGRREQLARLIRTQARAIGIGWASRSFIDQHGLTAAQKLAATRALAAVGGSPTAILLDGKHNYIGDGRVKTIVGGDALEPSISAASIIAKVARDAYMVRMHQRFPAYGFSSHVGYATPQHRSALQASGPCLLHRLSFVTLRNLGSAN